MKEPRTLKRLPRSLDDIRGLRVARWIRESTAGQYDRYGPASQREQQDRFIERHGLVDTGLVFQVAHSGTTVWRSATMTEMLAEARAGRVRPAPRRVLRPLAAQPPADARAPGGRPPPRRRRPRHVRPADPLVGPARLGRADLGGGRRGEVQPPPVGADHRRLRRQVRPPRRPGRARGPRLPALCPSRRTPSRSTPTRWRSPSACSSATPSAT